MLPWTVYPTENNHPNIKINDASGDILIIGGIHGDEPCGWTAIKEFYRERHTELTRPVTFLFANPQAAQQNERFIDSDLNRSFGSQYDSDATGHEGQLAEKLQPLIAGFEIVVSLHSTQSTGEPFSIFGPPVYRHILQLIHRVGVSKAICVPREKQRGTLITFPNVLEFECGLQQSENAVSNAKRIIQDSVAFIGGLENENPRAYTDVCIFELQGEIPKPRDPVTIFVENLTTVRKGTLVAETDNAKFHAPQDFAPILMSEDGYADILGYHGVEKGWLSAVAIDTHPKKSHIVTSLSF